jgi:imidazolonepropionase
VQRPSALPCAALPADGRRIVVVSRADFLDIGKAHSSPEATSVSDGVIFAPVMLTPRGPAPSRGLGLGRLDVIEDAAVAWRNDVITYVGPASGLPGSGTNGASAHRAEGAIIPGFVDCHTHLPFFGWRANEFEARLVGVSYRDLHVEGGIYRSARLLAEASDDEVIEFSGAMANEMLAHGTTAVELKTGYGLSLEAELRQARLARRLASEIPQTATVTLLACHAIPHGSTREEWVEEVCSKLIPAAANEGLADAVDVYVEDIAFSTDDLARVADVARSHGLAVRCHADQLAASGAAEAAVRVGSRSADHLNHVSGEGIAALGKADRTAAVLLPVSTLFLRADPAPAEELMNAAAAVALATDFNPGTSPCLSMPEVISVAASLYRIPPNVALTATTLNSAWVLGLDDRLGSLERGKRADFLVLDSEDLAMVPYRPGHNPVTQTWISGRRASQPVRADPGRQDPT